MRVLMIGQEFPPGMSAGLGIAGDSFTKGLSKLNEVEGSFLVPKISGDKNKSMIKLICAIGGYVTNQKDTMNEFGQSVKFIHANSILVPYVDAFELLERMKRENLACENKKF